MSSADHPFRTSDDYQDQLLSQPAQIGDDTSPINNGRRAGNKRKAPLESDYDDDEEFVAPAKPPARKRGRPSIPAKPRYGAPTRGRGKPDDTASALFENDDDEEDEPTLPEEDDGVPLSQTRAHALKQQFLEAGGMGYGTAEPKAPSASNYQPLGPAGGKANGKRLQAAHDPENHDIKTLRAKHHLSWAEIARVLNSERVKNGGVPNLSEAGVYGRFVRNAPRIAAQDGDNDFDVKDYMHLKETKTLDGGYGPGTGGQTGGGGMPSIKKVTWTKRFDEMLVETCMEVKKSYWIEVAEMMTRKTGRKFDSGACAERFGLL